MKKKRLIITIIAIICLILAGLIVAVSCAGSKVTGVKSLVAANVKAQAQVQNYHMDGTLEMALALDSSKSGELQDLLGTVDPKLPASMTLTMDAGPDTAHIITDANIILFEKPIPVQTAEVYLDLKNDTVYAKAGESSEWTKSVSEEAEEDQQTGLIDTAQSLALVGKTVLDNAVFEETEDLYTITMPAKEMGDLVTDLHLIDRVDLGIADVRDITVEGGQIIYSVDKETLLVSSLELKDVDIRGKGTYEDISVDLSFPTNGEIRFSRYNELEESEYAIPEEVLND